ncbi:MAG: heme o synthase [Thermoplasmata archaeon]|nr:heme o synthase [Thermoplasmata archaeon]
MEGVPQGAFERARYRDYLTLAKPGITGLILLVAVAGFFLASPKAFSVPRLLILLVTGASASAGAAMLNHYLDRDLDATMKRTRDRPLPGARIRSEISVGAAGLALSALGVGAATVFLNPLTGFSILLGSLTYVVVYTIWLKRRSSWNIVIGGFAGSAPALAGSAAAVGSWTPGVLALALLVFLWTPPHFWSLAILLKDDYQRAGLPMLPRMNDLQYSGRVVVVSAALLVPAAGLVALYGPVTWPAAIVLLALGLLFVWLSAPLWHDTARSVARRGFIYSGPYLLLVVGALVLNWGLLALGVPVGPSRLVP